MRYTSETAFRKHLEASTPHHLCRIYLVACIDEFEQRMLLDEILSYLPHQPIAHLSGEEGAHHLLDALHSPSLFGQDSTIIVANADKKLIDSLDGVSCTFNTLLLGTKLKGITGFLERQGVILDLTDEKPWEKEKRWIAKLQDRAKNEKKRLTDEAAQLLLNKLDCDASLLTHEMDKLLCFAFQQSVIGKEEIEAICVENRSQSLWQVAENLIWEKMAPSAIDANDFHRLCANLRAQLTMGAKMHTLIQSGISSSEWSFYFPKMWPKTIEKKATIVRQLGSGYFQQGLDHLFEIELLARSGAVPVQALFDLFRFKL